MTTDTITAIRRCDDCGSELVPVEDDRVDGELVWHRRSTFVHSEDIADVDPLAVALRWRTEGRRWIPLGDAGMYGSTVTTAKAYVLEGTPPRGWLLVIAERSSSRVVRLDGAGGLMRTFYSRIVPSADCPSALVEGLTVRFANTHPQACCAGVADDCQEGNDADEELVVEHEARGLVCTPCVRVLDPDLAAMVESCGDPYAPNLSAVREVFGLVYPCGCGRPADGWNERGLPVCDDHERRP